MPIVCLGLSYRNTPLEQRERAALTPAQQDQILTLAATDQLAGVQELVIVSTCNRTELYALCDEATGIPALYAAWSMGCALPVVDLSREAFQLIDQEAIDHLLRVSGGLDSQVIGEPQILGQVAESYERARNHHAAGTYLSALMQHAIQTGKRIRTETALGHGTLSISSIAAEHSHQIFGSLEQATVLVIGTGEMARGAVMALVRHGIDRLLVANHNLDHAQNLAAEFGGTVVPYTQLSQTLIEADLVITAVSAPHPILHSADLTMTLPQRNARPLVIFDIALPRNVSPEVSQLPGVRLFNLDDLQSVTDAHYMIRQSAAPQAEQIIAEEHQAFQKWQAARAVVPVIQEIRSKAETIRQSELDHLMNRLPPLDDRSKALIEEFSRRLVNKMLHQPTQTIKEHAALDGADEYLTLAYDLFGLTNPSA